MRTLRVVLALFLTAGLHVALAQQPALRAAAHGAADGFVVKSWTVADGLPVNTINAVIQSRSGYIWLATFDGLVRFDGVRFTTFNVANSPGLPSNRIVTVRETEDGTLSLVDELQQLVRFHDGTFTRVGAAEPLSVRSHRLAARGPDGRTWIAENHEIHVGTQLAFRAPAGSGNAMSITGIVVDHEGSVWFGTTAGGLYQLKPAVFTVLGESEVRGGNSLYSVTPARGGGVWAGSWNSGGISRIDGGRITSFRPGNGILDGAISMHEDRTGRLWVGLVPCALPSMRCQPMRLAPAAQVFAIHEDPSDGTFWFGTNAGLYSLRGETWTRVDEKNGAPATPVRDFLRTADGAIWMATNGGGLARYRDGAFRDVTTADGLPSNLVRALYQDADGWLWVGTEGMGLARLDPREWSAPDRRGRIVNIRSSDGLFDDGVHVILEDAKNRLWMNSNRGPFWVSRAELNAFADGRVARVRSTGYDERDGLRNREGNGGSQPAGARTPDGRLWFPTQDGLAVVDPASIGANVVQPAVAIERVTAGDTVFGTSQSGPIEIEPRRRDLQFQFTALSFLAPDHTRFRYRLAPYDKDWVDADTRRSASYTRVPPGHYTFRVIASVGNDVWTEQGPAVELNVTPRVYETRTFFAFILVALAALVWLGVRWRLSRLAQIANELGHRVEERTRDLRQRETQLAEQNSRLEAQAGQLQELDRAKSRFFANVSHELRTPLTLTIGPLEDARAELAEADNQRMVPRLDMALRNARRLFRLVNQILDVAKLDAGGMKLRARPGELVSFTRGVASAFTGVAERKKITFHITAAVKELSVWMDPDALEKVIANLLSNAFKFTPEGGVIELSLDVAEGAARLRIADSGPGIPAGHLPLIFERFYQVDETNTRAEPGTGIGLSLARELAELHGGTLDVQSGPGGGATFTLLLKLGRSHLRDDQIVPADMESAAVTAAASVSDELDAEPAVGQVVSDPSEDVTTLLVVDDNADLRSYVSARFEPRYRVVQAADGADAIVRARELIPDLVISDVMMPGTDGHAVVAALKASAETDFIPVILLTAQAEPEQRITGLLGGADDYIVKPFDMRELEVRVENLIASRRRLRARYSGEQARLKPAPAVPGPSHGDQEFLDRLRSAIEDNLADPEFGVNELATAMFQDRSHLFRRTRAVTGEPPSDMLRRLRLERAATLLGESAGTVAEVAYGVGFNSVSHFCRAFREAYGVTPSAYRVTTLT